MPAKALDLANHDAYVRALQLHLQTATGQEVELIETHISSLLLTPRLVYKLKKPVRLPFLDFSTLDLRAHFCREELRLNRRLAPQLYLCVVPVCGSVEAPRIGGGEEPIDHAVCMRRFATGALLSQRLVAGRLASEHIDRLARRLAAFHADTPRAPPGAGFGEPQRVLKAVDSVMRQLQALHCDLGSVVDWVVAQSAVLHDAWCQRHAAGAVRECHGDLHLANTVVLDDGDVTAFDCIEFDPALRWIDVMNDIAFACMDLKAHGRADLAWRLLDVYLQHGGDYGGLRVLRYYEVYRALVRALVRRLQPAADAGGLAVDYLDCARRLAGGWGEHGPRLAITCGLSGAGKSVLASALLESSGAVRLRSDVERKRLFGLQPLQPSGRLEMDLYTPNATQRTFERLRELARRCLLAGYPVIVDAAFLLRAQRDTFGLLAKELRVPFTILHCQAGEETLRQRVAERHAAGNDASEATLAVLERQLQQHEPPGADEQGCTLAIDTAWAVDVPALLSRWLAMPLPAGAACHPVVSDSRVA